jgi:hypothetical protein
VNADTITFLAIIAVSLLGTKLLTRGGRRRKSERARLIREARELVAAAREVDELELLYSVPAYDPALDAGCERLWDAIRDEQQKGDQ